MVNWLVDEILQERNYETGYPTLSQAAIELGHTVYRTKYIPFSSKPDPNIPFKDGSCTITYGTVQFCRQIERHYGRMWMPGMYFNQNVKSFSRFAVRLGSLLLNDDYYILPYGEFVRRARGHYKSIHDKYFFIKPESGLKEFTGQVIHAGTLEDDLKKLSPHAPIDDTTLCVIAKPKDIKAEFRYVICEKEVITGSEYRWDDVLDVRRDTHPVCDAMADKVAKMDWQADIVYVCDIALMEDAGARPYAAVIELNAFSSSGLYACDTYKIVEAVSRAAMREYLGEVEGQ